MDQLTPGYYRMHFGVGGYFASQGKDTFYPYAEVDMICDYLIELVDCPDFSTSYQIVFEVTDTTFHYHIPLILSPYGYSTYRGN